MMQLTVLGCWAPYPRAGGACSGYLLRAGQATVMLEAGNGTFSNLCRHVDFRSLDALFISHLHPDHFADLHCLRHAIDGALREGKRMQPLQVYMPQEPEEIYAGFKGIRGLEITPITLLPRVVKRGMETYRVPVKDVEFFLLPVPHGVTSYAIYAAAAGKTVVYSGDCAPNERLIALARGADLYLGEGSGLDKDAGYLSGVHHTAREAGETARRAKVKSFLLTHFWPEYDVAELLREAGQSFGGQVQPAVENKTYVV